MKLSFVLCLLLVLVVASEASNKIRRTHHKTHTKGGFGQCLEAADLKDDAGQYTEKSLWDAFWQMTGMNAGDCSKFSKALFAEYTDADAFVTACTTALQADPQQTKFPKNVVPDGCYTGAEVLGTNSVDEAGLATALETLQIENAADVAGSIFRVNFHGITQIAAADWDKKCHKDSDSIFPRKG